MFVFFRIKCDWFPNVHAVATLRCLTPTKTSCQFRIFCSPRARKLNFQSRRSTMIARTDQSLQLIWEQARENMGYHWLESLLPIQPDLTIRQFCQCWQSEKTIFDKNNSLVILALVGWPSKNRGKNMEGQIEVKANCRLVLTTTYFALFKFWILNKVAFYASWHMNCVLGKLSEFCAKIWRVFRTWDD